MLIEHYNDLTNELLRRIRLEKCANRQLIALAGPPASGKSTLLSQLCDSLRKELGQAHVVGLPMDGFHLDNVQLDADGTRTRKGSPGTFDVGGLLSLIQRLKTDESPIFAPEFDRVSDLSRNCAIKIESPCKVVLIEGNYLLLNQAPWNELATHFSLTVNIDVPQSVLEKRLLERWLHHGLSEADAKERALSNDLPNATTVIDHSMSADIDYRPQL